MRVVYIHIDAKYQFFINPFNTSTNARMCRRFTLLSEVTRAEFARADFARLNKMRACRIRAFEVSALNICAFRISAWKFHACRIA